MVMCPALRKYSPCPLGHALDAQTCPAPPLKAPAAPASSPPPAHAPATLSTAPVPTPPPGGCVPHRAEGAGRGCRWRRAVRDWWEERDRHAGSGGLRNGPPLFSPCPSSPLQHVTGRVQVTLIRLLTSPSPAVCSCQAKAQLAAAYAKAKDAYNDYCEVSRQGAEPWIRPLFRRGPNSTCPTQINNDGRPFEIDELNEI